MSEIKELKVTQIRSKIGRLASHKACLTGLGIRKINKPVMVEDTPENRGMINKISYMLCVEEETSCV
jgi:large subunit ribosomal protein L30